MLCIQLPHVVHPLTLTYWTIFLVHRQPRTAYWHLTHICWQLTCQLQDSVTVRMAYTCTRHIATRQRPITGISVLQSWIIIWVRELSISGAYWLLELPDLHGNKMYLGMFFRLDLYPGKGGCQCSLQLLIQLSISAPGTCCGWVAQGSVEGKVCCLTLQHMISTRNQTRDLLI